LPAVLSKQYLIMKVEYFLLTVYIQTALSGFVAILSFIKFRSREDYVKLIGYSFLLGFLCNTLAIIILKTPYKSYSNLPQTVYFIFNFCIITSIYYTVLKPKYKKWLLIGLVFCIPYTVYDIVLLGKSFMDSYSTILQSFFILTFTVIYFYKIMIDMPTLHLHHLPMFWFNSAFLIFNAGTFFLYSFMSYLINVLHTDLFTYWIFHNSLSIIEHLIIVIGLYYNFRNTKIPSFKSA
jgi:hypothetical protein